MREVQHGPAVAVSVLDRALGVDGDVDRARRRAQGEQGGAQAGRVEVAIPGRNAAAPRRRA